MWHSLLWCCLPTLKLFSYLDYDFHLHERSTINIGKSLRNEVWIFSLCYVWQWTESIFADTFFTMYYQDRKKAPVGWVRWDDIQQSKQFSVARNRGLLYNCRNAGVSWWMPINKVSSIFVRKNYRYWFIAEILDLFFWAAISDYNFVLRKIIANV